MPFVHVNDVKLHYEMEGSGPPLLMVAGTGLPGATWRTGPSAQYAAEGFTVITFDHRGTGGSDRCGGAGRLDAIAAHTDRPPFVHRLAVEDARRADHGDGGGVAWRGAALRLRHDGRGNQ